ncbi:terminase [Heyndrickxia sporothermodurans]|uniref:terminase TerL endonuclease subunit n=1 Tax=Heyndrickxia sporothermodurans TaxID=46224 RepID=UPI000D37FDEB|nr:terminase TerL endonuclease subunit [Heyndrickxia sporothermodurans]PTY77360.1 terminase [Heyndrickxia sporothermodurans]
MTCKNVLSYQTHEYIEEYFHLIESGELPACKEQYQLIDYVRKVLSRDDIYIKTNIVEDSVEIPARYFPYSLYPWQKFVNVFIFGVRWKQDDTLVFNRYFIYMGRGGGKNGYISYDSFFMMSKQHGISNYDIDIVATSEAQAKTSFLDVYNVLEDPKNEKKLKKAFYRSKVEIKNNSTNSSLVYNTSNARTKDGKRPGCVIFDEEHEYDNYDAIKVFTSGGGKKQDYREFHISTDGNVRGGPLDDLKEEARMILNGELDVENSTLFPFICKLDDPSEVDDPKLWAKANPSLPYNDTLMRKMKTEYQQMQRNAAIKIEFMTKRMNCPIEDTRFEVASYEDRLATNQPIPPQLKGMDAIGGVDFADVRDFCSVGVLVKYKGKRYWLQHTFIHHMALELQDINKDIIQLALDKGLAEIVYGKSIEPQRVVNWFIEKAKDFYIKKICLDTYRAAILGPKLEEAGFEVMVCRTGSFTHSKLSPIVDDCFINQSLVFGNDPLMRWYVGNVYVDYLGNGNKEYKKIDPEKRKTDGYFAFLHALNADHELEDYGDIDLAGFSFKPIIV